MRRMTHGIRFDKVYNSVALWLKMEALDMLSLFSLHKPKTDGFFVISVRINLTSPSTNFVAQKEVKDS